jgi:hypothetical protein
MGAWLSSIELCASTSGQMSHTPATGGDKRWERSPVAPGRWRMGKDDSDSLGASDLVTLLFPPFRCTWRWRVVGDSAMGGSRVVA